MGITQKRLKEVISYDKESGTFRWLVEKTNQIKIGDFAGHRKPNGYLEIKIDRKTYMANRLAVLYETGEDPEFLVDHKDNNPSNNRYNNLRNATYSQNNHNVRLRKDSTSKVKGVTYHKSSGLYQARVTVNRKQIYLGLFEDLELADLVCIEARNLYHKEFARHA